MTKEQRLYISAREMLLTQIYQYGRATYADLLRYINHKIYPVDYTIGWTELTYDDISVIPLNNGGCQLRVITPRRLI